MAASRDAAAAKREMGAIAPVMPSPQLAGKDAAAGRGQRRGRAVSVVSSISVGNCRPGAGGPGLRDHLVCDPQPAAGGADSGPPRSAARHRAGCSLRLAWGNAAADNGRKERPSTAQRRQPGASCPWNRPGRLRHRRPADAQPKSADAPPAAAGARGPTKAERKDEESPKGGPPPGVPAAPQAEWDVVPVFYGTDRTRKEDPKRIVYSSDRARRLELGRAL